MKCFVLPALSEKFAELPISKLLKTIKTDFVQTSSSSNPWLFYSVLRLCKGKLLRPKEDYSESEDGQFLDIISELSSSVSKTFSLSKPVLKVE